MSTTTRYTQAAPARPAATTSASTRVLLACGMIAGPLFVVSSLTQALTREGFDLRRHAFSMLSLGAGGWLQIVTFVLSGTLFAACAMPSR